VKWYKQFGSHRNDLSQKREDVLCGMRKFEKMYFEEFHLRNVLQITP